MQVTVWAPFAGRVDVVVGDHRLPMIPAETRGWWTASDSRLAPGSDYAFSLDGGEPLPDPRSAWQPHGVHGPSRLVDPSALTWTDGGWRGFHLPSTVLYELHVGTFTPEGTFDAAVGRLDHLVDLGVDAVEVMPVNAFPGAHGWGYDGVGWYAVQDSYGGPHAFARFVDACHARGLGVVLDVVYNHLGPDGNYLDRFGPYFTERYGTPWGPAVNLDDAHSDEVRRFVVDNALRWLRDFHVDGLRLDAVHALHDESAVHVLEQLAGEVDDLAAHLGRPLHLIAESDLNDPRLVRPREAGGYGLAAMWSDDFHHALHSMLTDETGGYYVDFAGQHDVAACLERGYAYDGRYSVYRQRSHGRPFAGLPATRLVGYAQNHDQVGNRARGERLTALVEDPDLLRVAAALVLTSPYVPLLFMGEEWGATAPFPYFTDHQDPGLQEAVRRGRRDEFAAFGWDPQDVLDPQDPATLAAAKLDWDERVREPHAGLLDWYRELIALRRRLPTLTDGRLDRIRALGAGAGWLLVERGDLTIVANVAKAPQRVPFGDEGRSTDVLLASRDGVEVDATGARLPPYSVAVLGEPVR